MKNYHFKHEEIKTLVNANFAVLLTGDKGTGKTTTIKSVSEDIGLKFYNMSMTRQVTLSHLLGFISINGDYIRTQFREAVEFGGLMLLDEIDAGDPNVLLALNTIENGFVAFPDAIISTHKDFRLCATSNPQDKHSQYTGRAKLDAATLDRFDIIQLPIDSKLEKKILGEEVFHIITTARIVLDKWGMEKTLSMRSGIRLKKRLELKMEKNYIKDLFEGDKKMFQEYQVKLEKGKKQTQAMCTNVNQLWEIIKNEQ